ncbi:hypothetical protein M885DRAFT_506605 [Pelagophyceae sp. CCMP2097]|nr:hypothetical protein M885DRAFT_506605 [Pelagophyceae sp. CCMP2097]
MLIAAVFLLAGLPAIQALQSSNARAPLRRVALAASQRWPELTPAGPYYRDGEVRGTLLRELAPGRVWALEQVQGAIFVHVPVRMTLVKLDGGGLLGYSAVAATEEMLQLLASVEAKHGPLLHVVLPTTAVEHKLFAVALAKAKKATLWIVPDQFSFPVDLPLGLLGFPRNTGRIGGPGDEAPPWAKQVRYKMLGPLISKDGISNFEELVCYDSASKTMLCCDLLVSVSEKPPQCIVNNDARALLFHARDFGNETVLNTPAALARGWRKIALFSLYFQAASLRVTAEPDGTLGGAAAFFTAAFPPASAESRATAGRWGSFFAWEWPDAVATRQAFDALRANGALLVPPILQVAILDREPEKCLDFADAISRDFADAKTIVPCHFDAPVPLRPNAIRDAFAAFLVEPAPPLFPFLPFGKPMRSELPAADLDFLKTFAGTLLDAGVIFPPKARAKSPPWKR